MACRANRQRLWTHRLMLEAMTHEHNCFLTLTYAEDKCPDEVRPDHLRDFLKRLRRRIYPARIRFYGVAEYGTRSGRPHYHLALFGYPACALSGASFGSSRLLGGCACPPCSVVREVWGFGYVFLGRLEKKSAQYIARYVLKKMTRRDDARLNGRHPEFARMSLRPGIGAPAMEAVSRSLREVLVHRKLSDVPLTLRVGRVEYPLGRYLRRLLRSTVFSADAVFPIQKNEQLPVVRAYAWQSGQSVSSVYAELFGTQDQQVVDRGTI